MEIKFPFNSFSFIYIYIFMFIYLYLIQFHFPLKPFLLFLHWFLCAFLVSWYSSLFCILDEVFHMPCFFFSNKANSSVYTLQYINIFFYLNCMLLKCFSHPYFLLQISSLMYQPFYDPLFYYLSVSVSLTLTVSTTNTHVENTVKSFKLL